MQKQFSQLRDVQRSILLGVTIGLGIGLVFAAGFFFRDIVEMATAATVGVVPDAGDYFLLEEVQALINEHYLREQPDFTQRHYAAVRGLLASIGDPYTFFIDPPVAATESDTLAGTYGGIGIQVTRSSTGEVVMYPFTDSAAANAGINNGDVLLAINGTPIDPLLSIDAIDQQLLGEVRPGNGAEITIRTLESSSEETLFIEYDVINVPSVIWRVLQEDAQIGYVQILRFTARTPEEVRQAVSELSQAGVEALVVDLRDNSGGLLQESIEVADEFVDEGVIVYERDNHSERAFSAEPGGSAVSFPLIVLVNERTASGAELVAGALQDLDRAILIGKPTFGKGTVQRIFPLSDSSSLHVTSAEWLTPSRQPFGEDGLQPNVLLEPDPSGRDVFLEAAVHALQQDALAESSGT